MRKQATIGFITTLSGRWPQDLPKRRLEDYGSWLRKNVTSAQVNIYEKVAMDQSSVQEAINQFQVAGVDVVIQLHGAFTGDDVCCMIADELRVPIILWAPYEPPFDRDTRLLANALVSITMNAAALKRMGHTCDYLYGDKEDERIRLKLQMLVKAFSVVRSLRGTFLGLFGYRPTAFYNCAFDEALIRRTFGIKMESTELKVVFDRMDLLNNASVAADMKSVSKNYDTSILPEQHLENHSRLYLALREVFVEQGYDFATLKCWPEMGTLKATPCAVIGRLADDGINIGCEGDVDAGITMIVQNYLTGAPCFITDMINLNEKANALTYWHCGNAALSLINRTDDVTLDNHPLAGQGTAFYGALRNGAVTVARFCNIGGTYKLFLMQGDAVTTKRNTKGVMINVKAVKPVREVLDFIIEKGIPHHYSIVWEDIANEMKAVCKLLGIEVLEI